MLSASAVLSGSDWPEWRGPARTGVSTEKNLPLKWSAKENVKWKVEIPGNTIAREWYNYIWVEEPKLEKNAWMKGKTINEIAKAQNKRIIDAFLDLVVEEKLETVFMQAENNIDPEAMRQILNYPNALIGLSDGGAHVQFHGGYGELFTALESALDDHSPRDLGVTTRSGLGRVHPRQSAGPPADPTPRLQGDPDRDCTQPRLRPLDPNTVPQRLVSDAKRLLGAVLSVRVVPQDEV